MSTKKFLAVYIGTEKSANAAKWASHEEVSKMFLNHPHFSIFPGDSVEVMEMPVPSQHA